MWSNHNTFIANDFKNWGNYCFGKQCIQVSSLIPKLKTKCPSSSRANIIINFLFLHAIFRLFELKRNDGSNQLDRESVKLRFRKGYWIKFLILFFINFLILFFLSNRTGRLKRWIDSLTKFDRWIWLNLMCYIFI